MKYFSMLMNLAHYSRYEISHLLIALFLLNKFIIFFYGNLDGSLSRRAPLLIRVDFDLLLCFCNFTWLLLPSGKSSNCVSFYFASRSSGSLDIMNWSVFLYWCSSSFIRSCVWFIVLLIWVLIGSLKVSLVKDSLFKKKTVNLEDRRVNVSRSERLFAFNVHNQLWLHTHVLPNSLEEKCNLALSDRYQLVCRRHIDLFTSEWVIHLHILFVSMLRVSTTKNQSSLSIWKYTHRRELTRSRISFVCLFLLRSHLRLPV